MTFDITCQTVTDHVYYRWTRSTYRVTVDRYIGRLSVDYRSTMDRLSTDCRPMHRPICSDQLPVKYRLSSGQVSVRCRSGVRCQVSGVRVHPTSTFRTENSDSYKRVSTVVWLTKTKSSLQWISGCLCLQINLLPFGLKTIQTSHSSKCSAMPFFQKKLRE